MSRLLLAAILLFLTGATELAYEVAWARQLGVVLGHTADAGAVVVAAYFLGMAGGNALGGRAVARGREPLRWYAAVSIAAAAWAVALGPVLGWLDGTWLPRALHDAPAAVAVMVRAAVALAVLLPATLALGVAVPLLASATRGSGAAWSYAANLAGACAGTVIATFVLLGALGVRATGLVAAAAGAAAAIVALAIRRRAPMPIVTHVAAPIPRAAIAIAAASGAGAAAIQVLYTRALALTFHNSSYSFGAALAAFLAALAVGAAIAARCARADARKVAGRAALAAALLVPAGILILWALTRGLAAFELRGGLAAYTLGALGLALAVVGPAVAAAAVLLPTAWRLAGPHAIGRLTAWNNVAGAASALATSLVLVPGLGLWTTFSLVTALYAALGLALGRGRERRVVLAGAFAAIVALAFVARPVPATRGGVRVIARWDTAYGWLEVLEDRRGHRRLRENIHATFASSDNQPRLVRMGALPVLLHPAPQRALFFGLGTGITVRGALAESSLARVDVVERVAEMPEVARRFARWNGGALDDPRLAVHTADARFWLRGADARWDVIVTDQLVPWHSDAGAMYTVEHYREVARHLAPGGVFAQWIGLWQVSADDLALVADTTRAVFPHVVLWRGDTSRRWGLMAIIASDRPLAIDGASFAARRARLPIDDDPQLADPRRLAGLYVGDWPARAGAAVNRDDSLRLELQAPRSHLRDGMLVGDRLVVEYRRWRDGLVRGGSVRYAPPPGDPPWNPDDGLRGQMGAAGEDGAADPR